MLLVLLSASAFIFEILEHQDVANPVDIHFVREVVFFRIIYPLEVGILLSTLLQVQEKRNQILRQREIEQKLSQELMVASNWDQLCSIIAHLPVLITPAVGARLLPLIEEKNSLHLETDWWLLEPSSRPLLQTPVFLSNCGVGNHEQERYLHPFLSNDHPNTQSLRQYCLPLYKEDYCLGVLYLYLPLNNPLSPEQISSMNSIAPIVALAMDTAKLKNRLENQPVAIQNERERIARQLHDTLGQNLAYLRLKLDQMSTNNATSDIAFIQQDLERMRDIAHGVHAKVVRQREVRGSKRIPNIANYH